MKAKHLVENDFNTKVADRVYDLALDQHEEWWASFEPGEDDPGYFADKIFENICATYNVDPESEIGNLIYEHVFAGLT